MEPFQKARGQYLITLVLGAAFAGTTPVLAQNADNIEDADAQSDNSDGKEKFRDQFFDKEDGKLDFSESLAKGGFIPVPVIITEPAVDGGFGVVAQFLTVPPDNPTRVTRRMLGGVKTGNGSYGFGYFQSGPALDGRISYKLGVGRGKITLNAYPRLVPNGLEYTNKYKYGLLGSILWHLPDERFSLGPIIDFRKLESTVAFPNLPVEISCDFNRTLHTGALGVGVHFDSRDNAMTPTQGVNAYVEGKFNSSAFGSDRNFEIYDLDVYAFEKISSDWRLGAKLEIDAARSDFPLYFAPAIDLRGVQAQQYQGSTVLSSEVEVTRRINSRWSVLAFGGVGVTDAGDRRLFDNSGAVFSGGAGFRYRIARKLGLDAGVDVAVGPEGAVFYLQFGHAWGFGMD